MDHRSRRRFLTAVICLGIALCCGCPAIGQRAAIETLNRWSDSVYQRFYATGKLDRDAIDSVMVLYPSDTMPLGKEQLYRIIATYYHQRGKYDVSFPYLIEAEKSVRRRGDSVRWAVILGGIGEEYRAFNELQKADSTLRKALEVANAVNDTFAMAYVNGRYAGTLFQLLEGDSVCLKYYRESIRLFRALGDVKEVASHLSEVATVLTKWGEHDRAIEAVKSVNHKRLDSVTLGRLYLSMAYANYWKSAFDSAAHYARLAYESTLPQQALIYAFEAAAVLQKANDSLGRVEEAYRWALISRDLQRKHMENVRGDDIRIVQLEHERALQKIENRFLRQQQRKREEDNRMFKVLTVVVSSLALVLVVIALMLLRKRRSLRKTQARLLQMNQEVEEKNRELEKYLDVRDRMISVVSHDLRSPLASLIGLLSVMKDPNTGPEELRELLPMMESQLQRSIDFADNLIVWVKSQLQGIEPRPVEVDLRKLTNEVVALARPNWESMGVAVEVQSEGEAMAYADIEMTKFILRNLLHNAIKFSDRGQIIHIGIGQEGSKLAWAIADEGVGMSEHQVSRLFRMSKGKSGGIEKGAGIGLYLSHYFAELMKGSLTAASEQGTGSRFTLELPMHPSA